LVALVFLVSSVLANCDLAALKLCVSQNAPAVQLCGTDLTCSCKAQKQVVFCYASFCVDPDPSTGYNLASQQGLEEVYCQAQFQSTTSCAATGTASITNTATQTSATAAVVTSVPSSQSSVSGAARLYPWMDVVAVLGAVAALSSLLI